MFNKINIVMHIVGLIALAYIMVYILYGGEKNQYLKEYVGTPENIKIVFYICIIVAITDIFFYYFKKFSTSKK